jgi:hypothetical protein
LRLEAALPAGPVPSRCARSLSNFGVTDWVVRVPVSSLDAADSPRIDGENRRHLEALVASGATFPPIVVHRPSMRVIDGMHRLRTAQLIGQEEIAVRFYDGDDLDAFVLAVRLNATHGLPLSLADRRAAAVRIMRERPEWSDRAIAEVVGLSPKTVSAVRARSTEEIPQLTRRVGRDGRVRPVRDRVAVVREPDSATVLANRVTADSTHDVIGLIERLRADPSLRFNEAGRSLLRLLSLVAVDGARWEELAGKVPRHCVTTVADLAQRHSATWSRFAMLLRQRADDDGAAPTSEPERSRAM